MRHLFFTSGLIVGTTLTSGAFAEPPKVATDIAPVHSLVAKVMEGVGTPELMLQQGASPHGYSMRPSEASAVQSATLVVWMGPALTPWLERAIDNLAPETSTLSLMEVPNIRVLESRDLAVFASDDDHDDHADDHKDHDDHASGKDHDDHDDHDEHDDHDDHAGEKDHADDADHADHDDHDDHDDDHKEHAEHDDHADRDDHKDEEDHAGHDDHDHDGDDPHMWFDPENAQAWVTAIAASLSQLDPENASTYFGNAAATVKDLKTLSATLETKLEPVKDTPYVVYHDAYQYFETRFGLNAVGAISPGDASRPSAARVAELRIALEAENVACIFSEPQFSNSLVVALSNEMSLKDAVLDPMGSDIPAGLDFYETWLTSVADEIVGCLN